MDILQSPKKLQEEWRTDNFINKQYLCYNLRRCNNFSNHFILEYDVNDYDWGAEQLSVKDAEKNIIRLKTYLNKNNELIDLVQSQTEIEFDIDLAESKLLFRLKYYFHRNANNEGLRRRKAITLETYSYEEFRNLVQYVGYGDFERDTSYDYLKYFSKIYEFYFRQASTPEHLLFLYTNTPDFVFERMNLDDEKVMEHLITLTEYDDTGFFSGWKDESSALVNVLKAFSTNTYLLNRFKKEPELCNRIYYNLDGVSFIDKKPQSNRLIFANILMQYCLFSTNRPKKDAPTFRIGKSYKIATEVTELSGKWLGFGQSDERSFFLQQQKEAIQTVKIVPKEGDPTATENVVENMGEGKQYYPLEMVYFINEDDKNEDPETGEKLPPVIMAVPAIYVKAMADAEKWEEINYFIRITADILAVVLGIVTLATTGNPYLILAAMADLSLAGIDLTVQALREEIAKLPGGELLLKDWDLIYGVGGAIVAAPQLVVSFYRGVFVLLPKAAQNVQQGLRVMAISLFLDLNAGRFERSQLRFLQTTEWVFASGGFLPRTYYKGLVENGAAFFEIENTTNKVIKEYALEYKGQIIAQGNKYNKEYLKTMQQLSKVSYDVEKSALFLENIWKKIPKLSDDRKFWTCFNDAGTELRWSNVTEKDIEKSINAALGSSNGGKLWEGEVAREMSKYDKITDFGNKYDIIKNGKRLNNAGDIDVGSSKYIIECKESVSKNIKAQDFFDQFDKYLNPKNEKYINPKNKKSVLAIKSFKDDAINVSHPVFKELQKRGVIIITELNQIKNLK